uniref:Uncharacterized protein n=1 Tax=Glossina pallidipes TaxID=7398 RepID=A0A1A9ZJP0_GLOPL
MVVLGANGTASVLILKVGSSQRFLLVLLFMAIGILANRIVFISGPGLWLPILSKVDRNLKMLLDKEGYKLTTRQSDSIIESYTVASVRNFIKCSTYYVSDSLAVLEHGKHQQALGVQMEKKASLLLPTPHATYMYAKYPQS